jgi:hypothetical protein
VHVVVAGHRKLARCIDDRNGGVLEHLVHGSDRKDLSGAGENTHAWHELARPRIDDSHTIDTQLPCHRCGDMLARRLAASDQQQTENDQHGHAYQNRSRHRSLSFSHIVSIERCSPLTRLLITGLLRKCRPIWLPRGDKMRNLARRGNATLQRTWFGRCVYARNCRCSRDYLGFHLAPLRV